MLGSVLSRVLLGRASHFSTAKLRRWPLRVSWGLTAIHLGLFPLVSLALVVGLGQVVAVASHDEPMSLPTDASIADRHILLLNPPKPMFVGYFAASRRAQGADSGLSLQALANGDQPLTIQVEDDHTIVVQATKGLGDDVTRDLARHPFKVGETQPAGVFTAEVLAVNPRGLADRVRFRFERPLDDRSLAFFVWSDQGYVPFSFSAGVGASIQLPAGSVNHMVKARLGWRG